MEGLGALFAIVLPVGEVELGRWGGEVGGRGGFLAEALKFPAQAQEFTGFSGGAVQEGNGEAIGSHVSRGPNFQ